MKRCPECRRDYTDDTLLYCLDDGTPLLDGPATMYEPKTAVVGVPPSGGSLSEFPTRPLIHAADKTAILPENMSAQQSKLKLRGGKLAVLIGLVAVLTIGGLIGYRYFGSGARLGAAEIESIAVLPFENSGGGGNMEYLSDGIAESLISSLSHIPTLSVKSRSTVFRFKGKEIDAKKIGHDLSVQAILIGRVIQRGQDLDLYIELVDVSTEKAIWSQNYNRQIANLVSLQSDIARDVTAKLKTKLSGEDQTHIAKSHTENAEAYKLDLEGRYYFNKDTEEGFRKGIEYFNRAVEIDPKYALAYAGLADSYASLGTDYLPPKNAYPLAKVYALKAAELDPNLPEAHAVVGAIKFFYDWDWPGAGKELERIMELNPETTEPFACTLHYSDAIG